MPRLEKNYRCWIHPITHLDAEEGPDRADEDAVDGNADEGVYEQNRAPQLSLRRRPPIADRRDGREGEEHRGVQAPLAIPLIWSVSPCATQGMAATWIQVWLSVPQISFAQLLRALDGVEHASA